MKSTELRIGNWYMSVKFKVPVKCDLSDLYNLCANSDGAYNDPPIDEMFEPIPLTEDWLKKFGFKRIIHREYDWILDDIGICWDEDDKCFWIEINGKEIELRYVHTLQNLYFALTGKELTIK